MGYVQAAAAIMASRMSLETAARKAKRLVASSLGFSKNANTVFCATPVFVRSGRLPDSHFSR
jgi:hypothetical protein